MDKNTIVVSTCIATWSREKDEQFKCYVEAVVCPDGSVADVEWCLMINYEKGEEERGSGYSIPREDAALILQMAQRRAIEVSPDIYFEDKLRGDKV